MKTAISGDSIPRFSKEFFKSFSVIKVNKKEFNVIKLKIDINFYYQFSVKFDTFFGLLIAIYYKLVCIKHNIT